MSTFFVGGQSEDTLFHTASFLQPQERAFLATISKSFSRAVENAGSKHYEDLTGRAPEGWGSNQKIHDLNANLLKTFRSYPPRQVPPEITVILSRSPTIQEYKKLQQFKKARDTLVVWKKLSDVINNSEDFTKAYETLDATIMKASSFPEWMEENQRALNWLHELNLQERLLTELPPQIGNLARLQSLILTNNRLIKLPSQIGKLSQLRGLYLEYNHLTELPPQISTLPKLKFLNTFGNRVWLRPKLQQRWVIIGDDATAMSILALGVAAVAGIPALVLYHKA